MWPCASSAPNTPKVSKPLMQSSHGTRRSLPVSLTRLPLLVPPLLLLLLLLLLSEPTAGQRPPPNYSYHRLPNTSFSCRGRAVGGYYADVEAHCQMFHVCGSSQLTSFRFLCPNNTVFDQQHLICANWHQVRCDDSTAHYARNFEIFKTIVGDRASQSKSPEELQQLEDEYRESRFQGGRSSSSRRRVTGGRDRNRNPSPRDDSRRSVFSNSLQNNNFADSQPVFVQSQPSASVRSVVSGTVLRGGRTDSAIDTSQQFDTNTAVVGQFDIASSTTRPQFAFEQDRGSFSQNTRTVVDTRHFGDGKENAWAQSTKQQNFVGPISFDDAQQPQSQQDSRNVLPPSDASLRVQSNRAPVNINDDDGVTSSVTGPFFSPTVVQQSTLSDSAKVNRRNFVRRRKLKLSTNNINEVLQQPPTFTSVNRGFSATVPTRFPPTPSTFVENTNLPSNGPQLGFINQQKAGSSEDLPPNRVEFDHDARNSQNTDNFANSDNELIIPEKSKTTIDQSRSRGRGNRKFNPSLPGGHLKSFEFRKISAVNSVENKKSAFKNSNKKRKIIDNSNRINRIYENRTVSINFADDIFSIPDTSLSPVSATVRAPPVSSRLDLTPDRFKPEQRTKPDFSSSDRNREISTTLKPQLTPGSPEENTTFSTRSPSENNREILFNGAVQYTKWPKQKENNGIRENSADGTTTEASFRQTTQGEGTTEPLIIRKRIKIFSKPRRFQKEDRKETSDAPARKSTRITRKRISFPERKVKKEKTDTSRKLATDLQHQRNKEDKLFVKQRRPNKVSSSSRNRVTLSPVLRRRVTRLRNRIPTSDENIRNDIAATSISVTQSPADFTTETKITRTPRRDPSPSSIYFSSASPFTRATTQAYSDLVEEATTTTEQPVHRSTLPTNKEAPGLGRQSGFFVRPKLQLSSAVNSLAQRRNKITSLVGLARPVSEFESRLFDTAHDTATPNAAFNSRHSEAPFVASHGFRPSADTSSHSHLSSLLYSSSSPGLREQQQPVADYDYEYYDTDATSLEHLAKLARVNSQFKTLSNYKFL